MHLIKSLSGVEKIWICKEDHLPVRNLSKKTLKPTILAENLKIIIQCMSGYGKVAKL